jgi:hypothetical protein
MKSIIVRMPEQTLGAVQNLAVARGVTVAGLIRDLIHAAHDITRECLDAEALRLFEEGKLDRIGYGSARIRYSRHDSRHPTNERVSALDSGAAS